MADKYSGVWINETSSSGEIYQAFIPAKLEASISKAAGKSEWIKVYTNIDQKIKKHCRSNSDNASTAAAAAVSGGNRNGNNPHIALTLSGLVKLNSEIFGLTKSGFRSGPAWVGGISPRHAWYVAPPANRIKGLVRDALFFANDATCPASMVGIVLLLQLLLIHPFVDGNGRTARAIFQRWIHKQLGDSQCVAPWLELLWQFKGMHIHRCSLALRDSGSWNEWFHFCSSTFESLSLEATPRSAY